MNKAYLLWPTEALLISLMEKQLSVIESFLLTSSRLHAGGQGHQTLSSFQEP